LKISHSEKIPANGGSASQIRAQIEYMADLIIELRDMARNNRLETLAGLLDLASTEARLRAKDAR
jgi:hypothetical protein